jgi:uncharacterized protein (DUF2062 family)
VSITTTIWGYLDRAKGFLFQERCPHKLALSVSVGACIAFSPFIGLHTLMIILLIWLAGLNPAITLMVSHAINNPWTMVPVYLSDYWFGNWFFNKFLGIDLAGYNPEWVTWLNMLMQTKLGLHEFCLWSFLIGGTILSLFIGLILYPLVKIICIRIMMVRSHENYSAQ